MNNLKNQKFRRRDGTFTTEMGHSNGPQRRRIIHNTIPEDNFCHRTFGMPCISQSFLPPRYVSHCAPAEIKCAYPPVSL